MKSNLFISLSLVLLLKCGVACAQTSDVYAIVDMRPAVLLDVLNLRCPIKISDELTIQQAFSILGDSGGFSANCVVTTPSGKKIRKLDLVVSGSRLLIDNTEAANLTTLAMDIGGEKKTFQTKVFVTKEGLRVILSPDAAHLDDFSALPSIITSSDADAPSGFAIAITPKFSQHISLLASGSEVKDPNATIKLISIAFDLSPASHICRFSIDSGTEIKSGLMVNAELYADQSSIALVKTLVLNVTSPPTPLSGSDKLADQLGVAFAKALVKTASTNCAGKPFIVPAKRFSYEAAIGPADAKLDITTSNSRLYDATNGFPGSVFVLEGFLHISPK